MLTFAISTGDMQLQTDTFDSSVFVLLIPHT